MTAPLSGMTEDRLRTCLGWLKAHAVDDSEGLDVLTTHCDLEELADDLAEVCLLFISELGEPAEHLDRMFHALTITRRPDRW